MKTKIITIIMTVIISIVLLGVVFYFFTASRFQKEQPSSANNTLENDAALTDANSKTNSEVKVNMDINQWQTYDKTDWGLSFKYPREFAIYYKASNQMNIAQKDFLDKNFAIPMILFSQERVEQKNLDEWLLTKDFPQSYNKLSVDGIEAYQFEENTAVADLLRRTYFFNDNVIYSIAINDFYDRKFIEVYDLILSTVNIENTHKNILIDPWNTYNNSQFRYSLKYPKHWYHFPNLVSQDGGIAFSNQSKASAIEMGPDNIWITINIKNNEEYLSLSDWAAKKHPSHPTAIISDVKTITINGVTAIQQVEDFTNGDGGDSGYSVVTYLARNNQIYSIESLVLDKVTFQKHISQYNMIVESFEFTGE